ncbi:MAG: STAS domain-containing protein [Devosia sp.]
MSLTSYPLHLSGDLSLRTISELHADLQRAVSENASVTLDTTGVESIDTAAIQLLVSAARTVEAAGGALALTAGADTPVGRALIAAGLFAADGTARAKTLSHWTITDEAA